MNIICLGISFFALKPSENLDKVISLLPRFAKADGGPCTKIGCKNENY